MECKKCPYFESRREIAAGKVIIGFCKLRGKHISDTTKNKELCKDRAVVDVPADAKPVAIKPEPSLLTPKEKEQVDKAMQQQKPSASPTFAEMAAKQSRNQPAVRTMMLPPKAPIPSEIPGSKRFSAQDKALMPSPKAKISRNAKRRGKARPARPEKPRMPAQIVPPMKMTPQEAMKLLDQQFSGKINAKFTKGGNGARSDAEKEFIRRAVWGGGT